MRRPSFSWCVKPLTVRTKNSYERALFFRLKSRRGPNKAIIAVAASMLTAVYHILKNRVHYVGLGPDHFDQINAQQRAARLVHRLERLYQVTACRRACAGLVRFAHERVGLRMATSACSASRLRWRWVRMTLARTA